MPKKTTQRRKWKTVKKPRTHSYDHISQLTRGPAGEALFRYVKRKRYEKSPTGRITECFGKPKHSDYFKWVRDQLYTFEDYIKAWREKQSKSVTRISRHDAVIVPFRQQIRKEAYLAWLSGGAAYPDEEEEEQEQEQE